MRIRFLTVLDSGVEGFPFMPGQVIQVNKPSPWMLSYIDGVRAEVLPDEPVEVATLPEAETQPVPEPERAVDAPPVEVAATRVGRRGRAR